MNILNSNIQLVLLSCGGMRNYANGSRKYAPVDASFDGAVGGNRPTCLHYYNKVIIVIVVDDASNIGVGDGTA